jgi:hypothetical protein
MVLMAGLLSTQEPCGVVTGKTEDVFRLDAPGTRCSVVIVFRIGDEGGETANFL